MGPVCLFGSQIVALVLCIRYEPEPLTLDRMIGDTESVLKAGFLLNVTEFSTLLYCTFHISSFTNKSVLN